MKITLENRHHCLTLSLRSFIFQTFTRNNEGRDVHREVWGGIARTDDAARDVETRSDHVEHTRARFCGPFFLVTTRPPLQGIAAA